MKRALVISGGGSKGAFAVGAIMNLMRERKLSFDIVAGTSTGAAIAPFVVLNELDALRTEYTTVRKADILADLDLDQVFLRGCLYDTQPLFNRIKARITPARFEAIDRSRIQIFLAATCLQSGATTYFTNDPEAVRPPESELIRIASTDDLRLAMLASSNQPVLMPPVRVPRNSPNQYVDGGVREYAPLEVAIANGAEEVYAILLSPRKKEPHRELFGGLVSMLSRTISMLTEDVGYNDLRLAQLVTAAVRHRIELRNRLRARFNLSEPELDDLFDTAPAPDPMAGKRTVNVLVIRPPETIKFNGKPVDGLDFDPAQMTEMLEMGLAAARRLEAGEVLLAER